MLFHNAGGMPRPLRRERTRMRLCTNGCDSKVAMLVAIHVTVFLLLFLSLGHVASLRALSFDKLPRTSHLGPNFSRARGPCSSHSFLLTHISSLSAMMFAKTAPPRKTMCRLRGGSSILTLNFPSRSGSPFSTLVSHSCFSSFSNREGSPGYIELPPDKTIAL